MNKKIILGELFVLLILIFCITGFATSPRDKAVKKDTSGDRPVAAYVTKDNFMSVMEESVGMDHLAVLENKLNNTIKNTKKFLKDGVALSNSVQRDKYIAEITDSLSSYYNSGLSSFSLIDSVKKLTYYSKKIIFISHMEKEFSKLYDGDGNMVEESKSATLILQRVTVVVKKVKKINMELFEQYQNKILDIQKCWKETRKWSYESNTLSIKIEEYEKDECVYWLCHIITESHGQLKSEMSNGTYGGTRSTTSQETKRCGGILGINGSMFSYSSGIPSPGQIYIKNGKIFNGGFSNDNIMCIFDDGYMCTSQAGISGEELLDLGVVNTFCFGPTLIDCGDYSYIDKEKFNQSYEYPRTVIGMVRPEEYYVLVADGKRSGYSKGLTYEEAAKIMLDVGCTYAYNLDGGGSTTLYFNGKIINLPSDGAERPCGDILYFTE